MGTMTGSGAGNKHLLLWKKHSLTVRNHKGLAINWPFSYTNWPLDVKISGISWKSREFSPNVQVLCEFSGVYFLIVNSKEFTNMIWLKIKICPPVPTKKIEDTIHGCYSPLNHKIMHALRIRPTPQVSGKFSRPKNTPAKNRFIHPSIGGFSADSQGRLLNTVLCAGRQEHPL